MPGKTRKVVLSAINSELRLKNTGITISIVDPNPDRRGRLRIGRAKVQWVPFRKSIPRGEKTWEDLIDFILSTR